MKNNKITIIDKTAKKIYQLIKRHDHQGIFLRKQVIDDFRILETTEWKQKLEVFYLKKFKLLVMIICVGVLLVGMFILNKHVSGELQNKTNLTRSSYGGQTKQINLELEVDHIKQNYEVEVRERKYTREQAEEIFQSTIPKLEEVILGDNIDLGHVSSDLNLTNEIEDEPFIFKWECQDYSLVQTDGEVRLENVSGEGVTTSIKVIATYYDFEAEHTINITIVPPQLGDIEKMQEGIKSLIEKEDEKTQFDSMLKLPDHFDGMELTWSEKSEHTGLIMIVLVMITSVLVFYMQDYDLHKKTQERNQKMRLDYPGIVSKISVYLGAGMTMRGAWEKIVWSYSQDGSDSEERVAYEEMKITVREMKSGISEVVAYDRFGRRSQSQVYMKLVTLIVQNLKKGNDGLISILQKESETAFDERKNMARKQGEEVSAKLLLPMILQFGIVMLMIMIPAFMTF